MDCKHELKDLIGLADGIKCRACGKLFKDFTEIEKDRKPPRKKKTEAK